MWNFAANRILHQIGELRGLFDARTRLRAHVKYELATVRVREKILTEPRRQNEGGHTEPEKNWYKNVSVINPCGQCQLIGEPQTIERSNPRWNQTNGLREDPLVECFACSKYIASVGTRVRDRIYDASIANTTDPASGTNK